MGTPRRAGKGKAAVVAAAPADRKESRQSESEEISFLPNGTPIRITERKFIDYPKIEGKKTVRIAYVAAWFTEA